jgi:hypothetical protein
MKGLGIAIGLLMVCVLLLYPSRETSTSHAQWRKQLALIHLQRVHLLALMICEAHNSVPFLDLMSLTREQIRAYSQVNVETRYTSISWLRSNNVAIEYAQTAVGQHVAALKDEDVLLVVRSSWLPYKYVTVVGDVR